MSVGGIGGPRGPVGLPPEDDDYGRPPAPAPFEPLELRSPGGVDLFPRAALLPRPDRRGSSRVTALGESALAPLAAEAKRDPAGPQARLAGRIRGEMQDALRAIRADEAELAKRPAGCPSRREIEDRIDARVRRFQDDVALEALKAAKAVRGRGKEGALAGFVRALPPFLRESVARGGIAIPGIPGAFKPRADDGILKGPTGLDYKIEL